MNKLLKSSWLIAAAGSVSYLITTAVLLLSVGDHLSPQSKATEHADAEPRRPIDLASWNYINPDIDELSRQLKEKQEALEQREKDLDKLAEQIANEKKELAGVTNWVQSIQSEIDALFSRVAEEEAANMKEIVTVYQKMDAGDAARMLYELDDRRIAKIFKFLKQTEVSDIIKVWLAGDDQKLKRVHKILDQYHNIILPSNARAALD